MISKRGLAELVPGERRVTTSMPSRARLIFGTTSEVIAGSQEAPLNCRAIMTDLRSTSAASWKSLHRSRIEFQWMEKNFLSFRPARISCLRRQANIVSHADVLIDDRSRHFKGFQGTGILAYRIATNRQGDCGFTRRKLERMCC